MRTARSLAAAAGAQYWDRLATPIGTLSFAVDDEVRVVEVRFDGDTRGGPLDPGRCRAVREQLEQYFAGERRGFTLELAPQGTAFQQRVWRALREIPFGAVRNYGDIARAIGQPLATRAVGRANGANPVPIVVPCHRVIAGDGTIGGFSGGLPIKHRLLALEGVVLDL